MPKRAILATKGSFERSLILIAMACLLTACHRAPLICRSEYLYPDYLASEQINTPDPLRDCFYGQQVIVSWNLPMQCFTEPIELLLHVRYGDRTVETIKIPVEKTKGYWVYRLINRDYWCREGILAYRVEVCQEGHLLAEWNHHLWAEVIEIGSEEISQDA